MGWRGCGRGKGKENELDVKTKNKITGEKGNKGEEDKIKIGIILQVTK